MIYSDIIITGEEQIRNRLSISPAHRENPFGKFALVKPPHCTERRDGFFETRLFCHDRFFLTVVLIILNSKYP